MNKRLAASIVLAAAFVAVGTWAFGQRGGGLPEGKAAPRRKAPRVVLQEGERMPHDSYLIDDVDPARRIPVPQDEDEGRPRRARVRTVRPIERGPVFLIDDVDPARRIPVPQDEDEGQPRPAKVRAVRAVERGPVGRYAVAASEECMVLVDTTTGSTWMLCPAASGHAADAVWLPIRRIDDKDEAALWKAHEEELKKKATKNADRRRH